MSAIFNSERLIRDGVESCKEDTDETDGISDVVAAGGVVINEEEDGDDDAEDAGDNLRFLFLSFRTAVQWNLDMPKNCCLCVLFLYNAHVFFPFRQNGTTGSHTLTYATATRA